MATAALSAPPTVIKRAPTKPQWKGFVEGGVASITAGVATHPCDLIKVRMQLAGQEAMKAASTASVSSPAGVGAALAPPTAAVKPGVLAVTANVIRTEGATGLFKGVSATVLRQILYSTTRMGIYDILKKNMETPALDGQRAAAIPLYKKVGAGLFSGAIGASFGNPAELSMVRMQADGSLPLEQRRNYRNVFHALSDVSKKEGVLALWRGCGPTVYRAMIVTAAQLATYDQTKEAVVGGGYLKEGLGAHAFAAVCSGICASLASNPFDVIKTRLMNMRKVKGEEAMYKGPLDCALKTVTREGPFALYKGLVPTVSRQAPFTLILFLTLEQTKKLMQNV